jgi:hypothetical protein
MGKQPDSEGEYGGDGQDKFLVFIEFHGFPVESVAHKFSSNALSYFRPFDRATDFFLTAILGPGATRSRFSSYLDFCG